MRRMRCSRHWPTALGAISCAELLEKAFGVRSGSRLRHELRRSAETRRCPRTCRTGDEAPSRQRQIAHAEVGPLRTITSLLTELEDHWVERVQRIDDLRPGTSRPGREEPPQCLRSSHAGHRHISRRRDTTLTIVAEFAVLEMGVIEARPGRSTRSTGCWLAAEPPIVRTRNRANSHRAIPRERNVDSRR